MRRTAARAALWAAGLAIAALVLAIAGPLAFGARPYTVLTGSMEPAISPGDVVVAERIEPPEARIGDVVLFRDPADQQRTVTHRVERIRRASDRIWFVTRGDANDHGERWRIAAEGQLGRVVYTVPTIGHVAAFVGGIGPERLLTLGVLLLVANELWLIWRPARRDAAGDVAQEADRAGA